uniref:Ovule protein n=1 Tax=Globodera pallida TaxID=36090 RepID=A0A183C2R5_GLOPA
MCSVVEGQNFCGRNESKQYSVNDKRKQHQKSMDSQVLEVIRKHSEKKSLFGYLGSRFHLAKEMHSHKMVFRDLLTTNCWFIFLLKNQT